MKEKLQGIFIGLNSGTIISAVNLQAVSATRYGVGIMDWTLEELRSVGANTRKMFITSRLSHPRGDIDRLHMNEKKEEGNY